MGKIRFKEGKRYNSSTTVGSTRFFISVTKRTSRYLYVDFYSERPVTVTFGVKDFKRSREGAYKIPIENIKDHDPEYFFFVEYNERIWFEADNVR